MLGIIQGAGCRGWWWFDPQSQAIVDSVQENPAFILVPELRVAPRSGWTVLALFACVPLLMSCSGGDGGGMPGLSSFGAAVRSGAELQVISRKVHLCHVRKADHHDLS